MARSEDEELSDVPESWEDVVVQEEHSAGQNDSSATQSPQSSSDKEERQAAVKAQASSASPASTSSAPKEKGKKRYRRAREHSVDWDGEEVVEADNAHILLGQCSARPQRAERNQWGQRREKSFPIRKKGGRRTDRTRGSRDREEY